MLNVATYMQHGHILLDDQNQPLQVSDFKQVSIRAIQKHINCNIKEIKMIVFWAFEHL
ncbi:hypothetical protein BOH78_3939 [Pichia kudriavzevii]|uniref:Uncharacterized protein n=1 Tax=Pichia kudriavzevii TaxID=4909 RepID=A0A099NQX1_PICKU|nr:hypothetical protein JL09_g5657 [Pichia kudriavzevii]ONH72236.1 hypothetical protein BOH78_3939 [Pichia kudriavzevii]